ncbi:MAG TPA: RHS repeat-associated core domain-containing protein, partial [Ignavibacteria bacterium]|nr:RHS repeat-associated core domain-containing protein [Ignavibacteria bacterium]
MKWGLFLCANLVSVEGNRIRKAVFENPDPEALPIINIDAPSGGWTLVSDEYYVRGADGLEFAIYNQTELKQHNVYSGSDNTGKIPVNGDFNYYLKDHLGSIRVIIDQTKKYLMAMDYDAWGYELESRTFQLYEGEYKFTSKERDEESGYDYFGARYYDSRLGRWGQVEPLLDKYVSFSSYCYALNSPMVLKDVDGRDAKVTINNETKEI